MTSEWQLILLELMLGGFFAVACIRASAPGKSGNSEMSTGPMHWSSLLRFPGRMERLRRSRWQWFAMVALMLVLRLQGKLPLVLEGMVALEFALFYGAAVEAKRVAEDCGERK